MHNAWFRICSRYRVCATPPTVLGLSFWNYTGSLMMVWRWSCVFFLESWNYFLSLFFCILILRLFLRPNTTNVTRENAPCPRNSSYSFTAILLKVYRCLNHGLKISMWYFLNPEIIFCYFFHIFNLDFFKTIIPLKWIGSIHLVLVTPPTVLGWSFWNFIGAFEMVWRYACGIFRILIFFVTFFAFLI